MASKQELADASIDMNSDVDSVAMVSGMEDLRRRLEKMLQPPIAAPVDESQKRRVEEQTQSLAARREKVSAASGQLIGAALALACELMQSPGDAPPAEATVDKLTKRLGECIETDSQGRPQLTISLPDQGALRTLATTLAKLLES